VAETEIDWMTRYQDAIAALYDLHRAESMPVLAFSCVNADCSHEDECPEEEVVVCRECWGLKLEVDDEAGLQSFDEWPCKTIRTITGALSGVSDV
jgi:hypothetical protein